MESFQESLPGELPGELPQELPGELPSELPDGLPEKLPEIFPKESLFRGLALGSFLLVFLTGPHASSHYMLTTCTHNAYFMQ